LVIFSLFSKSLCVASKWETLITLPSANLSRNSVDQFYATKSQL
jgi:hypothetical protein